MAGAHTFLDHTADRRMKITGTDLESLFREGMKGLSQLLRMEEENGGGTPVKRRLDIAAPDTTSLLIDFLSEILTYSHIDKAVFDKVYFEYLETRKLQADIHGSRINGFAEEIKAVTYHEAEVVHNTEGNWESMVIFDI